MQKPKKTKKPKAQQFSCQDLDGKGRTLLCQYHGHEPCLLLGLGAMITGGEGSPLEIGITLHQDNVKRHTFNKKKASLDLWYSRDPVRSYFICPSTFYTVPEGMTVDSLNVYDV